MGDLVQDLRYGLRPLLRSPGFAFAATVLILTTVALGAIWVSARRATRVEPTSALRYE